MSASSTSSAWAFTTQRLVLTAIFGALIFALYLAKLAFFPVPNVSDAATILATPVSLAGIIGGPIAGLIVGAVFSIVAQLTFGGAFLPVSLMGGRPFIGLVAWAVYALLSKSMNDKVAAFIAGALGSVTNTVATVGIAMLAGDPAIAGATIGTLAPVLAPQVLLEAVICGVVCALVVFAVRQALGGRKLPL
jgi:uncharacterized membrane protein